MEMLFFGAILFAYIAAIAAVPWHGMQLLLALTWGLMALYVAWTIIYVAFKFATS